MISPMGDTPATATLVALPRPIPRGPGTQELLSGFVVDQQRRGLSEGTIALRLHYIAAFANWMAPRPLLEASTEDIEIFLDARDLVARTRRCWRSHLKSFWQWAVKHGLTATNPTLDLTAPKIPRLVPRPVSDEQLVAALEPAGPRMRSWLCLAAYAGLRCKEIAGFRPEDVSGEPPVLVVRSGKGGHQRIVPVHPDLAAALAVDPGPWEVDASTVSRSMAAYLRGVGVTATAHQLRGWFATSLYRATKDLRLTQELLGHADPRTTAGYAAFDPDEAEAVRRLRPRSRRFTSARD